MARVQRYFDYLRGRVNYLTHISRKQDCVYVEVPKAGCSVVKRLLQYSEVDGEGIDPQPSVHDRSISPSPRSSAEGSTFARSVTRRRTSVSVSCGTPTRGAVVRPGEDGGQRWLRDVRLPDVGFAPDQDVSFVGFLSRVADQEPVDMDIHWPAQHFLLSLGKVQYDFLGRFESFKADLQRLIDNLGLVVPAELIERRTPHSTGANQRLHDYYDAESARLVQQTYRD